MKRITTILFVLSLFAFNGSKAQSLTDNDILIAQDSIHSLTFDDLTVWSARRSLMTKLMENPSLLGLNTDVDNFYSTYSSDNIGYLSSIHLQMDTLYKIDSTAISFLQTVRTTSNTNADAIGYNDSLLVNDSSLTSDDQRLLRLDDSLRMDTISELLSELNNAYDSIQTIVTSMADDILSTNSGLSSSFIYEQNEITVNTIYLTTIGRGLPDDVSGYESDLYAIAIQCPLSGGPAVYFARSLYALLNDSMFYDDDQVCASSDPDCLVPTTPGLISGLTTGICRDQVVTYHIDDVTGARNYTWTLTTSGSTSFVGATNVDSVLVKFSGDQTTVLLSVTANNDCGSSVPRSLVISSFRAVSGVSAHVTCNGGTDGVVSVTASDGTSPYSYHWNFVGTTSSLSGQKAGVFNVTVTDAHACTTTATATITEPPALSSSFNITHVSCHSGANGSATISVGGGTPRYSYHWGYKNDTTVSMSGLPPGDYSITVTDAHGCTAVFTATVTQPAASLSATCGGAHVSCNGGSNGTVAVTASGGTTAYTYHWNNSATTSALTSKTAATYSVTVTDANSCTASCSFTVTQPSSALSATCGGSHVSCNGGSNGTVAVTASGGTTAYTYHWNNSATTSALTSKTAATYSVTVTDAHSCTASCSFTVTQPSAALTASASNNSTVCTAASLNLSSTVSGGTTGYSYSWSGPLSFSSTAANPTKNPAITANTGTYSLTVTDAHSCTATATTSATVDTCVSVLSLNLMIEGYYVGSGYMEATMYNEAVSGSTSTQTDTITVQLRNTTSPYGLVESVKTILHSDGTATAIFNQSRRGHYYYIAIKHRNAVQTWSHDTVSFTTYTSYDFTTAASKAYGSNQIEVDTSPVEWSLYSGDINQDENVDLTDYSLWDHDATLGYFGYYATDLNGDGNVDLLDWPVLDYNISNGIYSQHP